MMTTWHRIHIETVFAEDLLELPEGVFIRGAEVKDGDLILNVVSKEKLGDSESLTALYGNREEDEERVHLGMFEARTS